MKRERIWDIANAVLYEGYLLYPYRHSALKNRQRWTFGVVYPRAYTEARGGIEPCAMQTECLVTGTASTALDITVRFLHMLRRSGTRPVVGADIGADIGESDVSREAAWVPDSWDEGTEREVHVSSCILGDLLTQPRRVPFAFPGMRTTEPDAHLPGATITREAQALSGVLTLAAQAVEPSAAAPAYTLTVRIENVSPQVGPLPERADAVLPLCFVSTHTILCVRGGAFVSLLDPPAPLREAAGLCHNERTYPVLVGDPGEQTAMLSSPIILYDYPQIAPESAGALFDGTEIDEILTLRILALSDAEKQELRQGDEQARAILERTEALTTEQLLKLHGVIRNLGPAGEGGMHDGS